MSERDPIPERRAMVEIRERHTAAEFAPLRLFDRALSGSLRSARRRPDGAAVRSFLRSQIGSRFGGDP